MTQRTRSPAVSNLVAGELCLDFANTAEWHATDHSTERLKRYEDLVAWSRQAKLLDAAGATMLLREARRRPIAAAAALKRAVTLREAIYRILVASLQGRPAVIRDLDKLNRALKSTLHHQQLRTGRKGITWTWRSDDRSLDRMLWPIVRSAADLLTSERLDRVGQCADDRGCGWLFLDTTKNRSRRWCEMKDCGNRAKARRHYQRVRDRSGGARPHVTRGDPE